LSGSLRGTLDCDVETDKLKMSPNVYFEVFFQENNEIFLIQDHFLINYRSKIISFSIQKLVNSGMSLANTSI